METGLLASVLAIFLLAGFVKGVVGLGLPTVSLAVLTVVVDLPVAVLLMVIPSAVTNLWQAIDGQYIGRLLTRFWPLLIASIVGVWLAFGPLLVANPRAMTGVLGLVLCIYCASSLLPVRSARRVAHERAASPLIGLATGTIAGATGSLVLPVVPYLQALDLHREELVQMMGLSFTVTTCALGLAMLGHGGYDGPLTLVSVAALAPAILGMKIGQRVRRRLSERIFRRCLFGALFVIGIRLIWKGFL